MRLPLLLALPGLLVAAVPGADFTLPSGLRVALQEQHRQPLIRARLRLPMPPDPAGSEGLTTLLLEAWEATPPDVVVDGRLDFRVRRDGLGLALDLAFRSQDQEAALGALAQFLLRPVFSGSDLELLRLRWIRRLEAQSPARLARQRWLDALRDRPQPGPALLGSLDAARLEAHHRRLLAPAGAVLGLGGDLDSAQARQLTLLTLGTWSTGPASAPAHPAPRLQQHPDGPREALVGAPLVAGTPRERAALAVLLEALDPGAPIQAAGDGTPACLTALDGDASGPLPARIQAAPRAWIAWAAAALPGRFEAARERRLRLFQSVALGPADALEARVTELAGGATLEDLRALQVGDLLALVSAAAAKPRLLLLGIPAQEAGGWIATAPELAAFRD